MSIEDTLRQRIATHLRIGSMEPLDDQVAFARIMADVEVALVMTRREVRARTWRDAGNVYGVPDRQRIHSPEGDAAGTSPLPTRTRQVLREEPVPGRALTYRWANGRLELWNGCAWAEAKVSPADAEVMRVAVSLHDNPTRTVEEPADESNPWPEVEP